MRTDEPVKLTDALSRLQADHETERRLLESDLKEHDATPEQAAVWLEALDETYRLAATTLFRIDNGA